MVLDAPHGVREFRGAPGASAAPPLVLLVGSARSTRRDGSTALTRDEMLDQLANCLMTLQFQHPVRVAIDGVDAAGKTTLADALAGVLIQRGRAVIRASIDGFHRPRAERHRQGANSPEGYYADSFDYDGAFARRKPRRFNGSGRETRSGVCWLEPEGPALSPTHPHQPKF